MERRSIDVLVGLFMLMAAGALMFLALKVSGLALGGTFGGNSYKVKAVFTDIGKLNIRAPVKVGGVEIGRVSNIELDPTTYRALVTLQINGSINNIPLNSSASITASGLLGDNFVEIIPGYEEDNLQDGDEIELTYPATSLRSLISTFIGGKK